MPSGIYKRIKPQWNTGLKGYNAGEKNYRWKGGKPCCGVCKKQLANYGAKHCPKHKPSAVKGKTWKLPNEARAKLIGRTLSQATKEKLRQAGLKRVREGTHNNYIVDRTKLKKSDRHQDDVAYKDWRKRVWLRDNFACKIANPDCKGRIEAHHILPWRDYVELRYEINNGITLCHAHHPKKRAEEKRLSPYFQELVSVSKESN